MPYNAVFDATQHEPKQSGGAHPVGNGFLFEITNTEVKPTAAGDGGLFEVEFTTPAGRIVQRYNLFNKSPKAVEIAHGQFSALCRAVGRYQVDFNNDGAILRGGRGKLDVGFQKGEEPTAEKPEGGYVELKKVYDVNGIEPGKSVASQGQQTAQPQPGNQPMTQQPGGGWGTQAPQGQTTQQPSQGGWDATRNAAVQQNQPGSGGGQTWQPGNNAANPNPPWGART